jgi:transposase
MAKPHVIVLSITQQGLTKHQAAHKYNVSHCWIKQLLARYEREGLEGLEPKPRRPHSSPNSTAESIKDLVLEIRYQLIEQGMDAGPRSIAW